MVKEKLIKSSKYPVISRLVVDTILKLEDGGRLPKPHKRLGTTLPRKSYKHIVPIVDNTIEETMYEVCGQDYDTLADKSLQQHIKYYLHSHLMS